MVTPSDQLAYCLEYIRNHPKMEPRTKIILAEIVKGDMTKDELIDLMLILAHIE